MGSITGISFCLKNVSAIEHIAAEIILFFFGNSTSWHCACNTVQSMQQKLSNSLLLNCTTNNAVLNPIDYKISRLIFVLQHEHKLWVNGIEKPAIGRRLGKQLCCIWVIICHFCVYMFYQVVQSNQIKSNMALIWVGKPQPSIKLNRLIR